MESKINVTKRVQNRAAERKRECKIGPAQDNSFSGSILDFRGVGQHFWHFEGSHSFGMEPLPATGGCSNDPMDPTYFIIRKQPVKPPLSLRFSDVKVFPWTEKDRRVANLPKGFIGLLPGITVFHGILVDMIYSYNTWDQSGWPNYDLYSCNRMDADENLVVCMDLGQDCRCTTASALQKSNIATRNSSSFPCW